MLRVPSIAHWLYIPGVLLVGLALGFRLGVRAARRLLEEEQRRRQR